jgi:hypothetical protein
MGPEYVYKRVDVAGASSIKVELSRAFNCKAMQAGKFISKLLPSA